jgi:hypothetical protein
MGAGLAWEPPPPPPREELRLGLKPVYTRGQAVRRERVRESVEIERGRRE